MAARRPMLVELLEGRQLLATLGANSWKAIGPAPILNGQTPGRMPVTGRIAGVSADPTDARTLYVAAAGGGVWKTTDGGIDWTPLTDDQATLNMGSIAVAPSNPQVIYAGTGEANNSGDSYYGRGVLKSTDGGASWTLLGTAQFDRKAIAKIVVHPTNPDIAYLAVSPFAVNGTGGGGGVWKTTDGGRTWANTTAAAVTPNQPFYDLVIDPTNPQVLYTSVGLFGSASNGVYKTTDGGATWAVSGNFPAGTTVGRTALAISKSNPLVLYASVAGPTNANNSGQLAQLLKTTDGGANWAATTGTPPNFLGQQGWYDNVIAVDPTDPNVVYAGGSFSGFANGNFIGGLIRSRDGGATWTDLSVGANGNGPHVDYHAMAFDAGGKLIVGSDGGVWRLENASPGSINWAAINGDLAVVQFTGIAQHPTNPDIVYGGSQDNGTEKYTGSEQWQLIAFGDGGFVQIDTANPDTIYHTYFYSAPASAGFIRRSDDGGRTFVDISQGINPGNNEPGRFYIPYVADIAVPGRVLLGTDRVYESTNKGSTWTRISTPGQNGWTATAPIDAIASAPTDVMTIYASAGGRVFVTTNRGGSWTDVSIPGAADSINRITVDPTDSKVAYAVRNRFNGGSNTGHVFRTTNGGQTWTNLSGNLPDLPTHDVVVAKQPTGDVLFVGNDIGVYASYNLGATWSRFKTGLPNAQVVDLDISPATRVLAAGTHGRGAFQIIYDSPITLTVTPPTGVVEGVTLSNVVVATFTDETGAGPADSYSARIDWGDTTPPETVPVTANPGGTFTVRGTHAYRGAGSYPLTVTVTKGAGLTASDTKTVVVGDTPIVASPATLQATEGMLFSGVLATFTDGNALAVPSDYTISIDWRDGSTTNGGVTRRADGTFEVLGSYLYAAAGTYRPRVTIKDADVTTAVVDATVIVADTPLVAHGVTLRLTEGQRFSGVVATFTDGNPVTSPGDYRAKIRWDDRTITDGVVTAAPGGGFQVSGSHTFRSPGTHTILVTIQDSDISTATATSTAIVTDAPLTAAGVPLTVIEGAPFTGVVASFVNGDPTTTAAEYTVTILWGDNSPPTAGVVAPDGKGGFNVVGSHAYPLGTYTISVSIRDADGTQGGATTRATVVDAPITATPATLDLRENTAFAGPVATFSDANPNGSAGEFSATIAWGDGSASFGAIVPLGGGRFAVNGSHVYPVGSYPVTVEIVSIHGSRAAAVTTARVANAPLTAAALPVTVQEQTDAGPILVGAFTDADPLARSEGNYVVTIAWGDGTTSPATLLATGGNSFLVQGRHAYAQGGSYPVSFTVLDLQGGSADATGQATVVDRLFPLAASLSPLSDSGMSAADGITSINRPTLTGTAEPGASVAVDALSLDGLGTVALGRSTADAQGRWTLFAPALADGRYLLVGSATDADGRPSSAPTALLNGAPLVIDTVGPQITGLSFEPATGRVRITVQDSGGALDPAGLLNPGAFAVSLASRGRTRAVSLSGLSAVPSGPGMVTLTGSLGRQTRPTTLTLTARAAMLTDVAGNPLDGEFSGALPGGNGRSGGDFAARIGSDGRQAFAPQAIVPFDPIDPRGAAAVTDLIRRNTFVRTPAGTSRLFAQSRRRARG